MPYSICPIPLDTDTYFLKEFFKHGKIALEITAVYTLTKMHNVIWTFLIQYL